MSVTVQDWLALLAAITALLFALRAARQAQRAERASRRTDARVAELEQARERDRHAESQSAQLVPSIERAFGPAGRVSLRLQIENIGRGPATGVRVRVDGQPLTSAGDGSEEAHEIMEIPPGIGVSYPLGSDVLTPEGTARLELNWLDAAGRQQTSRTTLRSN